MANPVKMSVTFTAPTLDLAKAEALKFLREMSIEFTCVSAKRVEGDQRAITITYLVYPKG